MDYKNWKTYGDGKYINESHTAMIVDKNYNQAVITECKQNIDQANEKLLELKRELEANQQRIQASIEKLCQAGYHLMAWTIRGYVCENCGLWW